jgi:hypothetical protein
MTRWADIQSGRVDLARLAEQRGGWLGAGPEQDEMSEAIDRRSATCASAPARSCPPTRPNWTSGRGWGSDDPR